MAIAMCAGSPGCTTDADRCTASRVSYEGRVLYTGEMNGYDDSDFYALVWDDAERRVKKIIYATTRGWTYHNGARVDATDEARASADRWNVYQVAREFREECRRAARQPKMGRRVVAVKPYRPRNPSKQGFEVGTAGTVVWVGTDRYKRAYGYGGERVGVELDDGTRVFGDADKFTTENPAEHTPSGAHFRLLCRRARGQYRIAFRTPGFVQV